MILERKSAVQSSCAIATQRRKDFPKLLRIHFCFQISQTGFTVILSILIRAGKLPDRAKDFCGVCVKMKVKLPPYFSPQN